MDIKKIDIGTIVVAEFEAFDAAVILTKIERGKKTNEGFVLFGGNHLIDVKQLKQGQRVELEFAEGGPHGGHWRVRRLWNRHKGAIDPTIIIDPPELKPEDVWGRCEADVKEYGIDTPRGAACADPGLCSCPSCHQDYWCIGNVIQCTECNFKFPTDAWAEFSWGVQAKWRGETDYLTQAKVKRHPYFSYGYNNPPEQTEDIDLFGIFNSIDWKNAVGDTESIIKRSDLMKICQRCGKTKTGRRDHTTQICVDCESATSCRHYMPDRPIALLGDSTDYVCQAGVSLLSIAGVDGRIEQRILPCSFCSWRTEQDAPPVKCDKFTPYTVDELNTHDAEMESHILQYLSRMANPPRPQVAFDKAEGESFTAEMLARVNGDGTINPITISQDKKED